MVLAVGPTSSVAVVVCLLASVGFGGWHRATLPTPPTEKVPLHTSIDVADKPDSVPAAAASKYAKVKQQLQQHIARPHMRLPDGKLWTPHRAAFSRKTGQQCLRPAVELLLQPAQEQQQDLAGVTANEQDDFKDTPNSPAPGFTQANRLSQSFVDHLYAWGSTVPADVGGSFRQLLPVPFQQMATTWAFAWIVGTPLVLLGCWFCFRRRRSSTVDSSRCSDDAEEIRKPSKAGKGAGEAEARLMLQLMPSPSRVRKSSERPAAGKAAVDETSPQSEGEPEPESSLELLGPDGTMEPFQEAGPEQKVAVIRRGSGELAEVMRRCREGCTTWGSAPDDAAADSSDSGCGTPVGSGAVSTAEFHVTSSPAVRRGSSDLREVMRQRRQVCEEFESAPLDSTADTTALMQAVPRPVQKDMTIAESPLTASPVPVQKDVTIAENPLTASPQAPSFRGKDDFVKVMQKRRESCTEFRMQANWPEADALDTALEAPSQNDAAHATTKAGELAMTPPSAPLTQNGKELRSTSDDEDVARRQLHY